MVLYTLYWNWITEKRGKRYIQNANSNSQNTAKKTKDFERRILLKQILKFESLDISFYTKGARWKVYIPTNKIMTVKERISEELNSDMESNAVLITLSFINDWFER